MIRRYVWAELLAPFWASTAFTTLLFFVVAFLRGSEVLLGSGVTAWDAMRFGASMVPFFLVHTLPVAALLGVLLALGRLAQDGELAALAALGVPPRAVLWGPLLLGLVLSLAMVVLTFWLKPLGVELMHDTARALIHRNLLGDLKPSVFHEEISGLAFFAESVGADGTWHNVLLTDERGETPLLVVAPSCRPSSTGPDNLTFELTGGRLWRTHDAETTVVDFEQAVVRADLSEALAQRNAFRFGHDELSPQQLWAEAERAQAAGLPASPFLSAFHHRLALLFLPLAFALLATPIGMLQRANARGRAFAIGLGVYVAFFAGARFLVQLGERDRLSPWLAGTLPVVLCFVVAAALWARIESRGIR